MAILRPEWAAMRKRAELPAKWNALLPLQRKLRERGLAEIAEARRGLPVRCRRRRRDGSGLHVQSLAGAGGVSPEVPPSYQRNGPASA